MSDHASTILIQVLLEESLGRLQQENRRLQAKAIRFQNERIIFEKEKTMCKTK